MVAKTTATVGERLRARTLRTVLRAETWRRERIVNYFRFAIFTATGIAEWLGRSGHDHDHLTVMPFVFISWGVAVAVFNFAWLRRDFRTWIPAAITTIDIAVLTIAMRIVYGHAAEFNEPLTQEIERAMVGLILLLSVNVVRFSWLTSLWSAVCVVAAFGYLRVYSGTLGQSAILTDLLIFSSAAALLIYANISFRTVTERLLVDLRKAQEHRLASLRALVAGVTHEVNSPLGALKGNVQVSSRAVEILESQIANVNSGVQRALVSLETTAQSNRSAISRISSVIHALGSFARIDETDIKQVDLRENLDTCVQLLSGDLDDRIEVLKQYSEPLEAVCVPAQLNQVFMHILRNAVQSIVGSGKITIQGRREGDTVCIDITDTGCGFPAKNPKDVFSLQLGRKGSRVGMGLGLPISHSIVQDHGGTIEIDSEIGTGTTVKLRIPSR